MLLLAFICCHRYIFGLGLPLLIMYVIGIPYFVYKTLSSQDSKQHIEHINNSNKVIILISRNSIPGTQLTLVTLQSVSDTFV